MTERCCVAPSPKYNTDFVQDIDTAVWIISRPTLAFGYGAGGTVQQFEGNTMRITRDEIFNEPAGLLIEGGTTNAISTAAFQGAEPGGQLPASWKMDDFSGGSVAATVNAVSAEEMDVTLSGTALGNNQLTDFALLQLNIDPALDCQQGNLLVPSIYAQLVSVSGEGFRFPVIGSFEYDNSNNLVTYKLWDLSPLGFIQRDKPFAIERPYTVAAEATTKAVMVFGIAVQAGSVNTRFKLRRPQFEKGPYRSTFQQFDGTRDPDVVLFNNTAALGTYPYSFAVKARTPRWCSNNQATLIELSNNAANNRVEVYYDSGEIKVLVIASGMEKYSATLGVVPSLTDIGVAFSLEQSRITISLNCKDAVSSGFIDMPSGLNKGQLGGGTHGFWNDYVQVARFWNLVLPNETLRSQSRPYRDGLVDDFDQQDGPLHAEAPTGHKWIQIAAGSDSQPQVVEAEVSDKELTTEPSAEPSTASYSCVQMGSPVRVQAARYRFAEADLGGALAMLVIKNEPSHFFAIPPGMHSIWQETAAVTLQYYDMSDPNFPLTPAEGVNVTYAPNEADELAFLPQQNVNYDVALMLNFAERAIVILVSRVRSSQH